MNISLITGIYGQDSSYLSELLLSKNYIIYGITHKVSFEKIPNIRILYCDIANTSDIMKVLNKIIDDNPYINILEIYNLASQSNVGISYQYPEYTMNINAMSVLKLLEAIKLSKLDKKVKLFQASTSEMFGNNPISPKNENTVFNPISPYSISKLFAHNIVQNYRDTYNIFACCGILFNHESPRRQDKFVTRKITKGIGKILSNQQSEIVLGNIYVKRDWGHAKDYVMAMWMMLQNDKPKDYVISTGEHYSIKEFINLAFNKVNIELEWQGEGLNEVGINKQNNQIVVRISEEFYRKNELYDVVGDSSLIYHDLKWKPTISFDELVSEMVKADL